ncbi:hypothetical protein AO066_08645 [Pseudomonas fluorescens]|nr:hypothetical protein AO066_08645 [Pseudomonas fluorescens]
MATVPRKKPNKTPVGRLPDRRPMGGCPPGTQRLPSTQLRFADLTPYIPNLTPIPGTDGALNKAALTVSALGVIYILYAWFEQAENDFVTVKLNGEIVAHYTVTDDDAKIGKDITLRIASARFIDQANNTLQGFVKRLSGVTDETKVLSIWVDQKEPGGVDPQVSTPLINENLARPRFEDPNIEAFGIITAAAAQQGIKILIEKYPVNSLVDSVHHRKEGDVIYVSIGGVLVPHTVTHFEATGDAPISITINYGTWLLVTLGVNILEWFVRDKAGNQSIGFSVPRYIDNTIDGNSGQLLPEGYVPQSELDEDLNEYFIDIGAQSKNLDLEIPIKNYNWLKDDKIVVTYLGLTATGETLKHTETADVLQPNVVRIYVPLPLEFAKKLTGGRLFITYARLRMGVVNARSNAVIYSMRGTPVDNSLPAPLVHGLVGGVLPLGTDPVEITVPSSGQKPGGKLDLVVEGVDLSGDPVYATFTEIVADGPVDFFLDYQSTFAPLEGSYFKTYYVINNDTKNPSKSATVSVGDITVAQPPPTSNQVPPPEHVFDELVSKGNLQALVHPHSSIALNDEVRCVAIGSNPGGSFTTPWLLVTSIWFGSVLYFTIPRAIVLANKNGTMKIHWEVRTLPTDTPLKSLPLIVNVGAKLKLTECPSLLEGTYVSPCFTQLNPLHVWTPSPRTVTFRIKYAMLATDLVTLVIQGKTGLGTPAITPKPGVPDAGHDYITFAWLSNFVAAYVGEFFTAYVEVLRNGEVFKSPALTVNVDALPAQTLDLASVPEATGGVIDTSQSNSVEVKAWPFFNRQQAVFIHLKSSTDLFLRQGIKVSAAEFTAQRTHDLIHDSYLKGLANGATVTVDASVSLDETGNEHSAIKLKSVAYRINRQPVVSTHITVGAGEHHTVITKDSKTAFVFNYISKTVSVIDIEKARVVNTIQAPNCWGISLNNDGTKLLITENAGIASNYNYVKAYDTASYALLQRVWLNYRTPYGITRINGTGTYAYVSTYYNNGGYILYEITKINTQTGNVEKYITTNTSSIVDRLWISPENIVYTRQSSWGIRRFDTNADVFISNAPFSLPVSDIAFSNTDNKGYYASGSNVGTFDRLLNTIINIDQGFNNAVGVATHPFEARLYLTEHGTDKVHIFDTSEDQPKLVNTLSGFNGPQYLQVTPDGKRLLVSNLRSSTIALVDL